ncbi:MAG: DUF721 domain-containing protein [Gammaproteobacteria bacterium]|nr:DUF721 domain-containing protein [Gammaproteobacteria bacterium]
MDKLNLKKMSGYLQSSHHDLQPIFTKIKMLNTIHQHVIAYLETHLASHCQVANLVNNKLVIITASAAIATQLRYQSADLLKRFKENPLLKSIQTIELKVRPTIHVDTLRKNKHKKIPLLSPTTAAMMRNIAETLEDGRLKEIMERIASHVETES